MQRSPGMAHRSSCVTVDTVSRTCLASSLLAMMMPNTQSTQARRVSKEPAASYGVLHFPSVLFEVSRAAYLT